MAPPSSQDWNLPYQKNRHSDSLASVCDRGAQRSAIDITERACGDPRVKESATGASIGLTGRYHMLTQPSHSSGPEKIQRGRRRRPQAPWGAQASRVSGEVGVSLIKRDRINVSAIIIILIYIILVYATLFRSR